MELRFLATLWGPKLECRCGQQADAQVTRQRPPSEHCIISTAEAAVCLLCLVGDSEDGIIRHCISALPSGVIGQSTQLTAARVWNSKYLCTREHNAAPTDQNLFTQLCTTPSSPVGLVTNQPARLSVKKSTQSGSQAVTPPSRCSDPSLKPERSFVGSWLAKLSKHPFARHASTSPACFHVPGHVARLVWVNKRILARQSWANWPHLVLVGRRKKKKTHMQDY